MPLIDGPDGLCTIKNERMVPVELSRVSVAVGGKKLFEYNQDSGVLKLNRDEVPKGTLEEITKIIEKSKDGIEMDLAFPFPGPKHLKGIRNVVYFTPEETIHKDLIEEISSFTSRETIHKDLIEEISRDHYKGPFQKFKDFLSRYNPFH